MSESSQPPEAPEAPEPIESIEPIGPDELDELDGAQYSKDYWDIVFEQLGRRRLFKLALATLALLYGSAIYAPLIANDRPFVLEAINFKEYDQARKGLYPIALGLKGLVAATPEEFLEQRTEGSEQSYEESLEAELQAVADRIATLRAYLPSERHAALDEFEALAVEATALAREGRHDEAGEQAKGLKDRAKELRTALEVTRPDPSAQADVLGATVEGDAAESRFALVGQSSYPLWEAITAAEIFFMVLWALLLTWPLWNRFVNRVLLGARRDAIRNWRKPKILAVLAASVIGAIAWQLSVGGQMAFNTAEFKSRLTSGDIEATRAVFPPLAIGFAETHLAEVYRPPTWSKSSEMNALGFYVEGARAPRADTITGFMPESTPVEERFGEPALNSGWRHLLGTDSLGRDLFVRALYGGRVSLAVGIVSTVILMVIGIVLGCLAGYFGGFVDIAISRVIEIVICIPVFFLILVVVAFVGPSILNIMVVIGLLRWTGVARLARGEFLRLKELDFVVASRALGFSSRRTVFRHILPNAMGPLLVAASFSVAAGILIESGLSFLGFGIQLPIPSWGSLVNETRNASYWWIHVFPGLLIFLTVLCYNLVGDAVRDAMDPKMKVQ